MSGKIVASSRKLKLTEMKRAFIEPAPPHNLVSGVYESARPVPTTGNRQIELMLANIINRPERIEEKIDENVYPPESAIKPEFIRQVKKAEAGIRKGKGKTYESMDAFTRAISE